MSYPADGLATAWRNPYNQVLGLTLCLRLALSLALHLSLRLTLYLAISRCLCLRLSH